MLPPSPMPITKLELSPPSISEAVERARRNRRRRPPTGETAPATPDTDAGGSGQYSLLRTRGAKAARLSRDANMAGATLDRASSSIRRPQRDLQANTRHLLSTSASKAPSARSFASSSSTELVPTISATPPIAESDLEPIVPNEEQELVNARPRNLSPLDTSSAQDASLPSPSLSPITAAAHLAGDSSFDSSYNDDVEDDMGDLSTPETMNPTLSTRNIRNLRRRTSNTVDSVNLSQATDDTSPNPQLPTPTFMDISTIIHSFDAMPSELQTYVMYQMLRRSAKSTLRFVADVVNPALKRDFLADLPLELSLNIVKYLDAKSMCRAAQVSRRWRQIIDSDEKAWYSLLNEDGYYLPEGEVERAVREGWGWQYRDGPDSYERDLSYTALKSDGESSPRSALGSSHADQDVINVDGSGTGRKRKAPVKGGSHKRQRRKGPPSKLVAPALWTRTLDQSLGPIAHANAAAQAVPNPDVGLPSLRNLHLYKSLYHRHHTIRKAWMDEDSKPHHLAFKAHGNHVVTCLQFDTEKIITGSDDNKINVYDTKTGMKRKTLEGHEGGVWALQYDGNIMVSGSTDRSVRVWDIEKGRCLQVFQGHTSTVRCLVILKPTKIGEHPDGTPIIMPTQPLIITGSRDSTLRVWKLPQAGDRSIYQSGPPTNDYENPYFIRALTGHHHSVRAIAAHGDTLVSGSYDHTVRVWKISNGEMVHRLQGHTQKVYSVVLDHKRNRCISGSMDYLVKVWSLDTGTLLFNLDGHSSLVGLLDLSNERLVSAAADSTLRIWDPENGKCENILTAHTGAITCFQHDGQKVISGSDGMLKMWDIETGECVKDLLTGLTGVWQVRFNDRRCVAAVHRNNWTYIEVSKNSIICSEEID